MLSDFVFDAAGFFQRFLLKLEGKIQNFCLIWNETRVYFQSNVLNLTGSLCATLLEFKQDI